MEMNGTWFKPYIEHENTIKPPSMPKCGS